ncbi:armadillo repeat-containing protein 7 isoform X2 [Phyllostomus hastatus]|uniref:armadillo repeat-containing protein 7 isoform X2 n=1 Tax=Phyllostomus hastatus TaxID=9423 RepID=UPI001E6841B5|nr:armadillo repeat-containing protein 7 isoform X2 [Phyllostomus hastatus]
MAQKPKVDPHVGRLGYLQALVTEFQETESQDAKEQVLANLANFAYDPSNYQYLRQLQVLDLFLDSLSEENETLVEFAIDSFFIALVVQGPRPVLQNRPPSRLSGRLFTVLVCPSVPFNFL